MSRRSGAVSSDAVAAEVADELLLEGQSAVAAAVGGFFAAAGQRPGVLFGAVTVLMVAVGTGARVLDGRLRQPGLGTKRPRGFRDDEPVPDAARVAVPASVAALLVALTYDESHRLSAVLRPGVQLAQRAGSAPRAELLERIGGLGARALSERRVARPLVAVGGPAEGGLLTQKDLDVTGGLDAAAVTEIAGERTRVMPPHAAEGAQAPDTRTHTLVALDARGFAVVASYVESLHGIVVPELDVVLTAAAVPVRRGVPRVAPGSALAAPAPAAAWLSASIPVEARGDTEPRLPEGMRYGLTRDPRTRRVEPIRGTLP